MKKIENRCVSCQLPCIGNSCVYQNKEVNYCDNSNCKEEADYHIDGDDLCETCTEKRVQEAFDNLTLSEKAAVVDIDLHRINS